MQTRVVELRSKSVLWLKNALQYSRRVIGSGVGNIDMQHPLHWMLVSAILLTSLTPLIDLLFQKQRYALAADSNSLLDNPSPKMAAKITYDEQGKAYYFNKEGIKDPKTPAEPSKSVGGDDKLYSAKLPESAAAGVTVYDNVNDLSFSAKPLFPTIDGRQFENRIVYPFQIGTPRLVYSLKANGVKEDVILSREQGDSFEFAYQLELGSNLEARMVGDGVGIYSADTTLFGNISFGSDADREKVEQARKNSQKTNLAFYIPAPVIKESVQSPKPKATPKAWFELSGDVLTVKSTGLKKASYPLSIDPSIVVTSANDIRNGNNEGGIDFDDTNGLIKRSALTGGNLQSFAAEDNLNTARSSAGTALYNNCLYVISGNGPSGFVATVEYTTIDSSGNLSAWQSTTSTAQTHVDGAAVAYNGYLYAIEGNNGGNGANQIEYAKINADCTVGSWSTTTVLQPSGIGTNQGWRAVAWNGYVYVVGGWNGALVGQVYYNTVFYSKQNADGTLGSWTQTTNLPESRHQHAVAVHNGYLYIAGGFQGPTSLVDSAVKYIKIKSDGSLESSWTTTTSMPTTRADFGFSVHAGYLYASGGGSGSSSTDVIIAPIYANGAVGSWQTTSSMANSRNTHMSIISNGYLYVVGGAFSGTPTNSVEKAKIDPAGTLANNTWKTGTNLAGAARYGGATLVYNNYIYHVGGFDGTSVLKTVDKALLGSDGSIGSWSTNTAWNLVTQRSFFGLVAKDGYMYAINGCTAFLVSTCTSFDGNTEYVVINTDGSLGTWATDSTNPANTPRGGFGYAVNNGYVYMTGGLNGSGELASVEYAAINSTTHQLDAWTVDTSDPLPAARAYNRAVAWNGYLYVTGGNIGSTYFATVYYSLIGSSGNPGSWTALTAMTTNRGGHGLVVSNGYLYALGGRDSNSTETSTAEFSKIKTDGTLETDSGCGSTWCSTQSSANARYYYGYAASAGVIYVVGGFLNGTGNLNTSSYQFINNGGPGGTGSYSSGVNITSRGEHAAVVLNGYLYVIAGCTSRSGGFCIALTNSVQYIKLNADGSIPSSGSWSSATSLPSNRSNFSTVVAGGRIYTFGGCDAVDAVIPYTGCTSNTAAIHYAAPNTATGDITSWTANGTNLPSSGANLSTAYYNGYIYVIGLGAVTTTVRYTAVNTGTGVVDGTWATTSSLNTARNGAALVVYNGYLYAIGGASGTTPAQLASVEYAQIQTNGTLGSWAFTTSIEGARQSASAVAMNGRVYVFSGYNSVGWPGFPDDSQSAPVLANGKLGGWNFGQRFASGRSNIGVAANNGTIYATGGLVGDPPQPDALYTTAQTITRTGRYSKTMDMDLDVTPTKVVPYGTAGGVDSIYSVSSMAATNSAMTYGTITTQNPATIGSAYTVPPPSGGVGRYYMLSFGFDDTYSAIYPDGTTQSTLTSFDLYYRAASAKRLRGGKTFTTETQRGLDASP